jgi:hypothetical protein
LSKTRKLTFFGVTVKLIYFVIRIIGKNIVGKSIIIVLNFAELKFVL